MKEKVNKEEVFISRSDSFAIAGTTAGYTFSYSVDNTTWNDWEEATPANEICIIHGLGQGMYCKLKNNADDNVVVRF